MQRELMERSGLSTDQRLHDPDPEFDPLSAVVCRLDSLLGQGWRTSPTPTACVRIRLRVASQTPGHGRGPGAGVTPPCPDCLSAGRSRRAHQAVTDGVPSEPMIEGRRERGKKTPPEADGKRHGPGRGRSPSSMGIGKRGTDTIELTGWWRVVPRRGTCQFFREPATWGTGARSGWWTAVRAFCAAMIVLDPPELDRIWLESARMS